MSHCNIQNWPSTVLSMHLVRTGFPLFYWQKIQNFSRTFQDPIKNFLGPFQSPQMFKHKEENGIYLQYSECSPLQKIQHEAKKNHQHSTLYLSKQQSTQTGCYTIAACFPFEPLEKCMTSKDNNFPGLSRTLSFNFQDFPGPKWFSRTFQVLKFSRKKSRTFQEA